MTQSSLSGPHGGACVEVGFGPHMTGVRDSKQPQGPALLFSPTAWAGFLNATKHGHLDLN
jgi:hypothetical protein